MSAPGEMAAPTQEQIRGAWDGIAEGFDEFVTPLTLRFGEDVLQRLDVGPGMRVLDVATGSGALAVPAARLGAQVLATDISPTMVDRLNGRARKEGLSTLEGAVMDGQQLDISDDTFDLAVSLNGVSLFPDLGGGLGEMVRVTKPGARVSVIAFGAPPKAEFLGFFIGALTAAVPGFTGPPMDPPPLPFQVADPAVLRRRLSEAGLEDIRVEPTTWHMEFRSADHFWDVVTHSNPLGHMLVADLSDEQRRDVLEVVDGMLRERSGAGPTAVLTTEVNIGIGTK